MNYDPEKKEDSLTLSAYASYFRVLFNASYLNEEMSEKALRYLAHSVFRNGMAAGIRPRSASRARQESGSSRHRTQTASRPRFCSSTSSASSTTPRGRSSSESPRRGTTSVALPGSSGTSPASCMRKWTSSPSRTSRDPRPPVTWREHAGQTPKAGRVSSADLLILSPIAPGLWFFTSGPWSLASR